MKGDWMEWAGVVVKECLLSQGEPAPLQGVEGWMCKTLENGGEGGA